MSYFWENVAARATLLPILEPLGSMIGETLFPTSGLVLGNSRRAPIRTMPWALVHKFPTKVPKQGFKGGSQVKFRREVLKRNSEVRFACAVPK